MNADAKNPSLAAVSSADVQARIDEERRRLLIEQNMEHDLTGQRIAPLEAGDDAALDRVEAQINQCRDRQFRIQERLEILERRLAESQEREASADLDAIADRANRARELGERLIRTEYRKHAEALAAALSKLTAIDDVIHAANRQLTRASRDRVTHPNAIRCRAAVDIEKPQSITVDPSDPRHPAQVSGDAVFKQLAPDQISNNSTQKFSSWKSLSTGAFLHPVTIEVMGTERIQGIVRETLTTAVNLPGIDPNDPSAFWSCATPEASEEDVEAVARELDSAKTGKLGKTAGRLLASLIP